MISLAQIFIYLMEAMAIVVAVYLISKKTMDMPELVTMALGIAATFIILDLYSPAIATGARQGSGFGMGYNLVGGANSMPNDFYGCTGEGCTNMQPKLEEGMDDYMAVQYYRQYNPPYHTQVLPPAIKEMGNEAPIPTLINQPTPKQTPVQENFADSRHNPFETTVRSVTEVARDGNFMEANRHPNVVVPSSPILYNPLTPPYGYRYQFPKGWDNLKQPHLSVALNRFRNNAPSDSPKCQVGPYGNDGQYNPDYRYTDKQ